MDTTEIENGDLITSGGVRAPLANTVTQLYHEAKGGKGFGRKVLAIPSLQEAEVSNSESS